MTVSRNVTLYTPKFLLSIAMVILMNLFSYDNALADNDKEMCHWSPHGGKVTLTVDPCPGTDSPSFYYAYYTQEDGVKGGRVLDR
jgi:hypothetical protein